MIKKDVFARIVQDYDAIFFDAFGVLKDYWGIIEGVSDTITHLLKDKKEIFIVTNDASRSPHQLAEKYQLAGIKEITHDKIISSGMLAREYLRYKVKEGKVAYLGTDNSAHYIEALGLSTIPINRLELDKIDDITALVLLDDEGFDWNHDLSKAINLLRYKNIPVVVANTDRTYPVSRKEINIAVGGIANMLEEITSRHFIRFGKPDAQMFMFAFEQLQHRKEIQKNKILMVGDTLHTDIIGGNKFGLDTCLVLSGNTLESQLHYLLDVTGIQPTYICDTAVL